MVNKTLAELEAHEKPTITIFNKMDKYEAEAFDKWLEPEVKNEILDDLKQRWENETMGNCVFVSAMEKTNIDLLRQTILNKVMTKHAELVPDFVHSTGIVQQRNPTATWSTLYPQASQGRL